MPSESIDELRELRALFRQQERWVELAEVLEKWRDGMVDPGRRAELEDELVELYEFMLQMEDDSANQIAETRLESIYRGQGTREAYERLATVFLDKAERHSDDINAFVAARMACVDLFENELGQPQNALLVLTTALGSDVLFAKGVVHRLDILARKTGQWLDLLGIVDELVERMSREDPRLGTLFKHMAEWAAEGGADRSRIVRYLEAAVSARPTDLEALEALESFYRSVSDRAELAKILRLKADAIAEPEARASAWLALAEHFHQDPGHLDDAAEAYQRVLSARPLDVDALIALDEIYSESGRWTELARILESRLQRTESAQDRTELERRLAEILSRSGAVDEAIARFRHTSRDAREFIQALKTEAESSNSTAASARLFA